MLDMNTATFLLALSALPLFGQALLGSERITRSSLLGFDVPGVGQGLSLDEAAEALASLRTAVTAACRSAGRSLSSLRRLHGVLSVRFTGGATPVATVTLRLQGPVGAREELDAETTLLAALRGRYLVADVIGRLTGRTIVEATLDPSLAATARRGLLAQLDGAEDPEEREACCQLLDDMDDAIEA